MWSLWVVFAWSVSRRVCYQGKSGKFLHVGGVELELSQPPSPPVRASRTGDAFVPLCATRLYPFSHPPLRLCLASFRPSRFFQSDYHRPGNDIYNTAIISLVFCFVYLFEFLVCMLRTAVNKQAKQIVNLYTA